jgi:hypothetical protein
MHFTALVVYKDVYSNAREFPLPPHNDEFHQTNRLISLVCFVISQEKKKQWQIAQSNLFTLFFLP